MKSDSLPGAMLLTAALLLEGCDSPPPPPQAEREIACTLVFLKTGPKTGLSQEESQKVFAGHFANMTRLAREGHLLLAGPFGKQRHDPALRGIFVLDTPNRDAARELAETDPGFQAGVFVLEYHDLVTPAPLRAFLASELAAMDRAEKQGKQPAPGEGGRTYVLLTAEKGDQAAAALQAHPAVLLLGRLDGTRVLAVLDAKEPGDAPQALGAAGSAIGPHTLDGWFASGTLAKLGELKQKQP